MFNGFSEIAREYAENYSTVKAVEEAFQRDVIQFWKALRKQLNDRSLPANLWEKRGSWDGLEGWYWWLAHSSTRAVRVPCLWFRPYQPGIVTGEGVQLDAGLLFHSPTLLQQMRVELGDPSLSPRVKLVPASRYTAARILISCGGTAPVKAAADELVPILQRLWAASENALEEPGPAEAGNR